MKAKSKKSKKSKITKEEFRKELLKILEFQKYILNLIENDMEEFTRITGLKSVPYDENRFIDIVKIKSLINSIKIKRIKFNK